MRHSSLPDYVMMSCVPVLGDKSAPFATLHRIILPLLKAADSSNLLSSLDDRSAFSLLSRLVRPLEERAAAPLLAGTFTSALRLISTQARRSSPTALLLRSAFIGSLANTKWETNVLVTTTLNPDDPVVPILVAHDMHVF